MKRNVLGVCFFALFAIQLFVVLYFNLFLLKNHCDTDSSWGYLRTSLMWEEKRIASDNWDEQTTLQFDSSELLATPIYGMIKNPFVAVGIANIVILICIILCVYRLLKMLDVRNTSILITLNLLMCPYLTNGFHVASDASYASVLLTGFAWYNVRALLSLLIVYECAYIDRKRRYDFLALVAAALSIITGMASGFFVAAMVLVPVFLCILLKLFISNDIKALIDKKAVFCYALLALSILGKVILAYVLGVKTIDTAMNWIAVEAVWRNIGAVFQGLLKLVGALPKQGGVMLFSAQGIVYVFPLIIFCVVMAAILFWLSRLVRCFDKVDNTIFLMLGIIVFNFVMFSLLDTRYGDPIFEERYLLIPFLMMIMLVALMIDQITEGLLFKYALSLAVFVSVLVCDIDSDRIYIKTTNDDWNIDELVEMVDSQDARLVYLWGGALIETQKIIRPVDLDHVYKAIEDYGVYHHWGDYKYLEDAGDYNGPTLMIVERESDVFPEKYRSQYTRIGDWGQYEVLRCSYNPIDLTAGITGAISTEYPSTPGVSMSNGEFDGISYVSNGDEGYVMAGPGSETVAGTYDFELDYEIIAGNDAVFDVALDENNVIASKYIDPDKHSIILEDVTLEDGHTMEYRVFCNAGTSIRISKVSIIAK